MSNSSATLLFTAHPAISATLAETTLTAGSPRTGVLDEIRAETDRAHNLVLAGNYQDAVVAYQAVRNRIFRLLTPGGPVKGLGEKYAAPHDLKHLREMVRASATLVADLVPGAPDSPVIQADLDPSTTSDFATGARAIPHAGDDQARRFTDLAALGQAAFDDGEYELAVKRLSAAADQAGEDRIARASLLLNAGAAATQAGQLDRAEQLLHTALDGFQGAQDPLGAAQAAHNLAVVSAARGDAGRTESAFKETDELSRDAAGAVGLAWDVLRALGRAGDDGQGGDGPGRAGGSGGGTAPSGGLPAGLPGRRDVPGGGVSALRDLGRRDLVGAGAGSASSAIGATAGRTGNGIGANGGAATRAGGALVDRIVRRRVTEPIGGTTDLAGSLNMIATSAIAGIDQRATSAELQRTLGAGAQVIVRDPLVATGWSSRPLTGAVEQADRAVTYSAGVLLGSTINTISWQKTKAPTVESLLAAGYEARLTATTFADLRATLLTGVDLSVQLAHLFYYVIPVGLAEAYAGLGQWETARQWLYRAADYPYLNKTLEAPAIWLRIAQTHLGEGDACYKRDEFAAALATYSAVVSVGGGPGAAALFTHAALAPTGALAGALLAGPTTLPAGLDAGVGAAVLEIAARVRQLAANLDWFGVPAAFIPPFTFDYLQNAARFLGQQAQAAERDFIQFMERYDSGKLTRLQLDQAAAAAQADAAVATQQAVAAQGEVQLAQTARTLANTRKSNSDAARTAYATMANEQIWLESEIAWYSSQNSWELDNPIPGDGRDIHEVIAADRSRLGQISRDYELMRMQQNSNELAIATHQAADQVALSQARAAAATLAAQASGLRRQQAQELAAAFDASAFTPEVWKQLADFMRAQAQRYLHWATRVARLMERAYEFDFDTAIDRIRVDYSAGAAAGLLGSDQLLADVDYFTYDRITRTTHKTLRASQKVSLAERFPYAFATEFRRTGEISFNTLLADLERDYPGAYNHRIQSVEVEIVGLTPAEGLRGTLSNSGTSQYRAQDGSTKWRLQDVDTMLISAYSRNDAMMFRPRPELLGVFEGVGMASGWTLRFPPATNDVDYRFVVDVQVTFHYEAQFDRQLAISVGSAPTPAEALRANTSFSFGNDFPDRFFRWQSEGSAVVAIGPEHLPHQHLDPKIRSVSVQLLANAGAPATLPLTISAPGGATATVTPNATGRVASTDPALAALAGTAVRGDWTVATGADAASRAGVYDLLLFIEYDFTPRTAS